MIIPTLLQRKAISHNLVTIFNNIVSCCSLLTVLKTVASLKQDVTVCSLTAKYLC